MERTGTIIDFHFNPLMAVMPSTLRLTVDVPSLGHAIELQETGTIEDLSKKYEFDIKPGPTWDFKKIKGRRCLISDENDYYSFLRFL